MTNQDKLNNIIFTLGQPYSSICIKINEYPEFFRAPGGVNHHARLGGLIEHTLEVVEYCLHNLILFPAASRDILVTSAIFHDLGKIWEYELYLDDECYCKVKKTKQAEILHHTYTSLAEFTRHADKEGLDRENIERVSHCIASHHYYVPQRFFPILPQTIEALILCNCDHLSAMFGPTK